MVIFLLLITLGLHGCLAKDICTKSAVLQELGMVQMAVAKKIPVKGDLSVQKELVDIYGKEFSITLWYLYFKCMYCR